mmetsp:Transcript_1045/g.3256  ORF Transcript_1045/g.3256 Transcript_1045/m.3256 type:complete len:173 (-) Transcript_1045:1529-2047(-)
MQCRFSPLGHTCLLRRSTKNSHFSRLRAPCPCFQRSRENFAIDAASAEKCGRTDRDRKRAFNPPRSLDASLPLASPIRWPRKCKLDAINAVSMSDCFVVRFLRREAQNADHMVTSTVGPYNLLGKRFPPSAACAETTHNKTKVAQKMPRNFLFSADNTHRIFSTTVDKEDGP